MAKTLKVETMQKRTAEHKELIIDELEYCKRLIDNIISDTKKIEYQHQYGLDTEPSDARYAVEEAYRYMATIRAILSRYWKNKHDEFVSYEGYEDLRAIRLSKQKMFKDKMDEVLQCVDTMDII